MTALAALAALDAPHEELGDDLEARSKALLEEFLGQLAQAPRDGLDAAADRLMSAVAARLRAIANPISRGVAAESLVKVIDARGPREREQRDIHAGLLIWPWRQIQEKHQARLDDLAARQKAGQVEPEAARKERAAILADKRHDEKRAAWSPTPLARWVHISRGLIYSRIVPRMPHPLPDIPIEVAEVEAERAGRVVRYIDAAVGKSTKGHRTLRDAVEEVRNEAIQVMLGSPKEVFPHPDYPGVPDDRGMGITNADIARELRISTARVAQLRKIG